MHGRRMGLAVEDRASATLGNRVKEEMLKVNSDVSADWRPFEDFLIAFKHVEKHNALKPTLSVGWYWRLPPQNKEYLNSMF